MQQMPKHCEKIRKSGIGILIWFVNQVAEAVEKEFLDKYIGTLAYQYTRAVPKISTRSKCCHPPVPD